MRLARLLPRVVVALGLVTLAPAALVAQDAPKPILETLAGMESASAFLAAVKEAGLEETLKGAGPFTVYVPGNSSFERIPADTLAALKADKARFTRVIKHHVLPGKVDGMVMMNLPIYSKVPTMAGDSMVVYHDKGGIKVDLNLVKTVDVLATNGVIHTVHKVILVP